MSKNHAPGAGRWAKCHTILDNRQEYIYPMDERGALIDELVDWGQYVLVRGLVRRVMAPMGLGICVDKLNGSCVGWMMEL